MRHTIQLLITAIVALACWGCDRQLPQAEASNCQPAIFPDYCGVTVPCNIAPLNFRTDTTAEAIAVFARAGKEGGGFRLTSADGSFRIPLKKWRKLVSEAQGDSLQVTLYQHMQGQWKRYEPFAIHVSADSIDTYMAYRLIPPAYRMWGEMGIYERCLENFEEEPFLTNRLMNNNCMNCHSFCMQDPDRMLFHQRSTHGGTYYIHQGHIEKLDTKTDKTISAFVYPSWHPSGRYVAFSTNDIKQDFHFSDANRIEVFDQASDVIVYDVERHEALTDSLLMSADRYETFPTFSPDGQTLYFCSAETRPMPEEYDQVRYSLVGIRFDAAHGTFGSQVDTLFDGNRESLSARFPRVSPDGRRLLFTVSAYGNFSIWHRDADLRMIDLSTGATNDMEDVNSHEAESYHSWSSNSRWFVFSSRRDDGLYTRPYICHLSPDGKPAKPFVLPQADPCFYDYLLLSYNIPEFIRGKVKVDKRELMQVSKYGTAEKVR